MEKNEKSEAEEEKINFHVGNKSSGNLVEEKLALHNSLVFALNSSFHARFPLGALYLKQASGVAGEEERKAIARGNNSPVSETQKSARRRL